MARSGIPAYLRHAPHRIRSTLGPRLRGKLPHTWPLLQPCNVSFISYAETADVTQLAEDFIHSSEQLYYRGKQEQLSVCTVNVYYLVHFATCIQGCGLERYW